MKTIACRNQTEADGDPPGRTAAPLAGDPFSRRLLKKVQMQGGARRAE
jgi:hypothetical protein